MSAISASCVGYVKYDPDLRFTVNGVALCKFKVENDNGSLYKIVTWEDLAMACAEKLLRNDRVGVKGYLKHREWVDSSGNKQDSTEIIAQRILLLDPEITDMAKVIGEIKADGS